MATKMRLIDGNALIEHLDRCIEETKGLFRSVCVAIKCFVEQMPTVDAVEVVHGRWIKRGNEKECSACKFIYYSNHDDFNFCPNCGAKMDGERRTDGV